MAAELFLSSAWLDDLAMPARGRRSDLSDVATLHRFVMSLFGPLGDTEHPRASAGILFRSELVRARPRLLVQSTVRPLQNSCLEVRDISPMLDSITAQAVIRMRLVINSVKRDSKTRADRPIAESELDGWIRNKLDGAVEILDVLDLQPGKLRCARLPIAVARLEANAQVANSDHLLRMIRCGVGRRKSHGCGLVSIVPIG